MRRADGCPIMHAIAVVLIGVLFMTFPGCDGESDRSPGSPSDAPVLTSISPSQASVGDSITVKGSGFSTRNTGVKIGPGYLNGVTPTSDTAITFNLPSALSACPPGTEVCIALAIPVTPGTYPVAVVNANGTSNALTLHVVAR